MKIKTSELSGIALDWAVAECRGKVIDILPELSKGDGIRLILGKGCGTPYFPSYNWSQGGPIIERERISINPRCFDWYAVSADTDHDAIGQTPIIAAMRCYVASRLGKEVEIPDELISKE